MTKKITKKTTIRKMTTAEEGRMRSFVENTANAIKARKQYYFDAALNPFSKRLVRITGECRDDMHEPDEQGISARFIGSAFDNASGDARGDTEELTLIIESKDGRQEQFNVATLVALARIEAERRISSK